MQKWIVENIFRTFERIKEGIETNQEISRLFQTSFNITKEYLRKSKKKLLFMSNREVYELNDAVIEIVTPLFLTRNGRKYDRLILAYEKWDPPVKTNSDALFFLHQLIFIRAENYLSKIMEKIDPVYSKILRSLNYKIIQSGYYKIRYMGQYYISKYDNINPGYRIIKEEEILQLPADIFNKDNYLEEIFSLLKTSYKNFAAISLSSLVLKLKQLNIPGYFNDDSEKHIYESIDSEEFISRSLEISLNKLFNSYTNKGKLTENETSLLSNALKDIAEDLKDGGINIGLYDYVKKYDPQLDKENYKKKFDNILEYLVKVMKLSARELLIKNL